jgi:hypothetical protein
VRTASFVPLSRTERLFYFRKAHGSVDPAFEHVGHLSLNRSRHPGCIRALWAYQQKASLVCTITNRTKIEHKVGTLPAIHKATLTRKDVYSCRKLCAPGNQSFLRSQPLPHNDLVADSQTAIKTTMSIVFDFHDRVIVVHGEHLDIANL